MSLQVSFFKCKFTLPPTNLTLIFFFSFPLPWSPLEYRATSNLVFRVGPKYSSLVKLEGLPDFFHFLPEFVFIPELPFRKFLPASTEQTLGLSPPPYLEHLWGKISRFILFPLGFRLVFLKKLFVYSFSSSLLGL